MKRSWAKGVAPALLVLGLGGGGIAFAWRQADELASLAVEPNPLWAFAGLLACLAAAAIVVRAYAQLRHPALYGFVLLLLPWALVQPFHFTNARGERLVERSGRAEAPAVQIVVEGGGVVDPAEVKDPPVLRFWGLPDSAAKRYPELPRRLRHLSSELFALGFWLLPLLVLAASPLGGLAVRRHVRLAVLSLLALEILLLIGLARGLEPGWLPPVVLVTLYLGAAAAAFLTWRSSGGAGGGVAALLLLTIPCALAEIGSSPSALGLPLKPPPFGVERAFMTGFFWLLLAVVAREWVVGVSHETQHDALTQIFNKAYAESIVNRTAGTDLGRRYCVAILDIDHFKKVNDTHGHGAGDDVLQRVAKTISDTVHNRGLVCRTGGEEMTVFFPGVDLDRAREVCEEIREAVEDLVVPTRDNEGGKVTLNVTLSVGVASNVDAGGQAVFDRIQDVVQAADKAVYEAKESGRNRVAEA